MSFLKALFSLLISVPDIVSIVKQIAEAIELGRDYIDLRIQLKKFDQAAEKAKDDKNTSELENLFNPKPKPADPDSSQHH